jgi:DNA helicase-2/ATP-dependent DNA helicase PcrA
MSIDDILRRELTDDQRAAATDPPDEVLCLACAGSGKSRTLAYRIARLLASGEPPDGIVAFTFTDKAAETIKRRVAQALAKVGVNTDVMGALYIGTIHSYCQHILGEIDAVYRQFEVLDENRLKLYMISRYAETGIAPLRNARRARYFETIRKVSDAWKTLNDEMLRIEDVTAHDPALGRVLSGLRDKLRRDQFIDFSLMIRIVVDALADENPAAYRAVSSLKHLMVDEYQDVSPNQEALIRLLHARSTTLFVVGDDDQSIYAWRGADVSNILQFQNRYPNASRHTLSENFRSTSAVVGSSDAFAAAELGPSRIAKNPRAAADRSPRDFRVLWFDTRADEAEWVAGRIQALLGTAYQEPEGDIRGLTLADFAVLMRSTREPEGDGNPRHAAFTDALTAANIHYSLEAGGGPFERPQVAVLRSTFELLRTGAPTREALRFHFDNQVLPAYPSADFNTLARTLTDWGRLIHTPAGGPRRRVYPQQLVHDLLNAFGLTRTPPPEEVMRDIGLFSRMIQDVEAVYLSVDSPSRFQEILNFLGNAAETGYNVSTDDLIERPDAVTVSTVHKAKGLEYPVVFVVDVESQRFPGRRRSYDGWLPLNVIQPALNRGAYQKTPDEEARLFYTAVTRAERYLYVSGAARLPGGKQVRQTSSFARRLNHAELLNDQNGVPAGLAHHAPRRRVEEAVLPTNFTEVRYYLRCPMDYQFRKRHGFSPPIPDMFGFGKTVHTAVERLHQVYATNPPTEQQAQQVARDVFHLKHVPPSRDPINNPGPYERAKEKAVEIAKNYSRDYHDDFRRLRRVEARFEIVARDCVISGAIDLLLKEDDQGRILDAEVIEFKAMEGGADPVEAEKLEWTELALQVQLYAKAAQQTLAENAKTGAVHLLKDNQRVDVPITEDAVGAAMANVEWAVQGILAKDYPMRPSSTKCAECDFRTICPQTGESFSFTTDVPPDIHLPGGKKGKVRAFSDISP